MTVVTDFRAVLILITATKFPNFIRTRIVRLMRNKRARISIKKHSIPKVIRMRNLIVNLLTVIKHQIIIHDSIIMLRKIQIPRRQIISSAK